VPETSDQSERVRRRSVLSTLALGAGAVLLLGAAAPQMAWLAGIAGQAYAGADRDRTGSVTVVAARAAGGGGGEPARSVDPLLAAWLTESADPEELFGGIPDRGRRQRLWRQLETFYERRGHQPAWSVSGRLLHPARELVAALAGARDHGLDPADYRTERLAAALEEAGRRHQLPVRLMALDTALTAAFLAHAADLCCGRVGPGRTGKLWVVEPASVDLAEALESALAEDGVAAALDRLAPPHPEAGRLAEALARYREIAAGGGWPEVPDGELLEPGDAAAPARLAALAGRLRAEGDLSERAARALRERWRRAGEAARYERPLVAAVRRFQARHGLEVDGKVGGEAVDELNASAAERVAQLALNIERWRWLPADLGDRHVRVNVAGYRLEAYERGREVLSMAVVVGRRSWPTPIFSDLMTRVELNPYWHVPESIARAEIIPQARRDPGYLARKGYQLLDRATGERLDPGAVTLSAVGDGVRVRQRPGRGNALGRIKFLFPNRFNVYLHDTPEEAHFERAARALSHGCIRVERPLELADFVFAGEPGWTSERVRAEIATGRTEGTALARPIPVHILYWTAFVDGAGRVHFRRDVYGHDERLAALLARERGDRLAAQLAPAAGAPADAQNGGTSAR